jgi:hypothetical protein
MSVCNAVSRTQFTQNPCHARDGGTAIDANAPSLIALVKQMELGFDAPPPCADAPCITGAAPGYWRARGGHRHLHYAHLVRDANREAYRAPWLQPADGAFEQKPADPSPRATRYGQSMRYASRSSLKKSIYVSEIAWLFYVLSRVSGCDRASGERDAHRNRFGAGAIPHRCR